MMIGRRFCGAAPLIEACRVVCSVSAESVASCALDRIERAESGCYHVRWPALWNKPEVCGMQQALAG